jgi:class 3 adenylate cyclase
VRAAREMIELIELLNVEREASDRPRLAIGVGIATGEMIAGYTGTHARATYTCIGDAVNLAARLEAHTKVAQRPILIDGETAAGLDRATALEPLGAVPLKGKAAAVQVFAVSV